MANQSPLQHESLPRVPTRENMATRTPVGQFLTRSRIKAGLTVEQLADAAGVDYSSLSMWERRAPVSVESYEKLRKVLADLPPAWAFTYPPLVHNYTGQKAVPPRDMAYGDVQEARQAVSAQIIVPDDADGYYTR